MVVLICVVKYIAAKGRFSYLLCRVFTTNPILQFYALQSSFLSLSNIMTCLLVGGGYVAHITVISHADTHILSNYLT